MAERTPEELDRLREQVIAERAAQGLPPTIEDPEVLARIARLLRHSRSAA